MQAMRLSLHKLRKWGSRRWMSQGAFSQRVPFSPDQVESHNQGSEANCVQKHRQTLQEYKDLLEKSLQGGGPKGIERHVVKNKKVLIRDRIKLLLDEDSPFLEIGALAGFDMPYGDLPGGGVVAGIGRVQGVYCMISGNDATVKAGTYYPITVKKSGRVQNIAEQNRLPVIYMPDSGGAFLPLQSEIFIHGGRGFYNQATMSAQGIAQVAVVCGSCTAGGAYNPTMSDEAVIVDRIGKIFLGGPPLVKAATGEVVTDEELGGAFMHSSVSGCTDYFAKTEEEAFTMCRDIVESLNMETVVPPPLKEIKPPRAGLCWEDLVGKEFLEKVDMYGVIGQLLDGSNFKEFKAYYGPGLITATGYLQGYMVGVVANLGEILEQEALKAAHFLDMCNRRDIPVVFLQNSPPPAPHATISWSSLKGRGAMCAAVGTLSVPKVGVTLSACYEQDHLLMVGQDKCGPSFNPNLNFAWPTAQFSSLSMSADDLGAKEGALYAAFNMLVDSVITPEATRSVLGESLRILKQQRLNPLKTRVLHPLLRL